MKAMFPLILFLPLCLGQLALAQSMKVGGPCEYTDIPGTAHILSVTPLPPDKGPNAQRLMRVLFSFAPQASFPPQAAQVLSRSHELRRPLGNELTDEEVRTADIRQGGELACTLKIIRSGTCTPIIFEFPTLFPKN